MSNNEKDSMSCDPANPRRSLVSDPESVKLATEDLMVVGDQASITVNATGSKKFIQQAFHRSLLITRPRSNSLGSKPPESIQTAAELLRDTAAPISSQEGTVNSPSWQRVPGPRNPKRKKSVTLQRTLPPATCIANYQII
ncbi:unnamed protein product [Euphydryas editha]|uniref:Uncharacterized protein n=1 Tax=Euphydryas editha TaxID=104508 RepID=A0AAU9TX38_EUPED|nr:unnamed protein product [Euphydryas editha]